MRINKYIAQSTGISRRAADKLIEDERVRINDSLPEPGQQVTGEEAISIDGNAIRIITPLVSFILNKPVGFVCSRKGQGNNTIYELLPTDLHYLKPVGRLDKNSSGLLLLTNDGQLAYQLSHPSFRKTKIYKIALDQPLVPLHRQMISDKGITLDDGPSKLALERLHDTDNVNWKVVMQEGRNRQIRRTFEALGYRVVKLHRVQFGPYQLKDLKPGKYLQV